MTWRHVDNVHWCCSLSTDVLVYFFWRSFLTTYVYVALIVILGTSPGLHSGRAEFESLLGNRISGNFSWLSSVPSGKCRDSPSSRPRPPHFKSSTTYHSSVTLPFGEKGEMPRTHWIGDCVGPRAGLDAVVQRKISCPCRESNPSRPVACRYTDWDIPGVICISGILLLSNFAINTLLS
jgi:hypothetical protein